LAPTNCRSLPPVPTARPTTFWRLPQMLERSSESPYEKLSYSLQPKGLDTVALVVEPPSPLSLGPLNCGSQTNPHTDLNETLLTRGSLLAFPGSFLDCLICYTSSNHQI